MARVLDIYPPRERAVYEEGDYPARCIRVEEADGKFPDDEGNIKPQYKFVWGLHDEQGQPSDDWISGWCNQVWGERAKYTKWYGAHVGQVPEAGSVDVDDCVDRDVLLTIEQGKREDGTVFNKVVMVRPLRQTRTAPRRAAPAPQRVQTETEVEAAVPEEEAIPF